MWPWNAVGYRREKRVIERQREGGRGNDENKEENPNQNIFSSSPNGRGSTLLAFDPLAVLDGPYHQNHVVVALIHF